MAQRLLRKSTVKVAEALQITLMEHANLRKSIVCVEGILIALFEQKDSIVGKIILELDKDYARIRQEVVDKSLAVLHKLPEISGEQLGHLQMSQDVNNLFEVADNLSRRFGDSFISTGVLFISCFDASVPGTQGILQGVGLDGDVCFKALEQIRGNAKITERDSESRMSVVKEYTVDLTLGARHSKLDPVVGRDREIDRVIQVLSRRKKNNPLLIGEPGVGKTVIVEGLANRIAQADVPEFLLNKKVLSLEIGNLLAGAKMQGEFEERLKMVKDEVSAAAGDIILFIDEIHTVVGAGRSQGSLDASNMLKPALASGELQCVGATTLKEYKKYIEADKALERRFQLIRVEEPTTETTIEILKGVKEKYEKHHGVSYTTASLTAAAELSARYQPDRFLPDKAFDLIDEAGSIKKLKVVGTPPEIRDLERQKQGLLDSKSQAFNEQDFESMASFQMQICRLEDQLSNDRKKFSIPAEEKDQFVDAQDIAQLVSESTGIPVQKMVEAEADKLLHLEQSLGNRVIGQPQALKSVADAIRRNRSGLKKSTLPIASFLFLGPTGVGKTELAKSIAEQLLDDAQRIIRIDMSEYMDRHDVSKLIGAPPGYVGYGEGGQLTDAVKNQPYSVVLFDEFEKAHKDIFNILLQVLDEGWLTDGEGRKVSFQNCVIIGTSNLGAGALLDQKPRIGIGAQIEEWSKDQQDREIYKEIKKHFLPEFLNRLDEVIIFNKLAGDELKSILELLTTSLEQRMKDLGYQLSISSGVKKILLAEAETKNYGARPLRRKLEQLVENPIATLLISDLDKKIQKIEVVEKNRQIVVKHG